jgi:G:T-mismatch repair DNA endonuclease (very short patch repair protein)
MPITESQRRYNSNFKFRTNEVKYADKIEGEDYVVCKVCGLKASQLTKHIKTEHNLSSEQYRQQYGEDSPFASESYLSQLRKRALTKNPSKGHGGRCSAHSKNFIYYQGLPLDEVDRRIAEVKARATAERIKIPSSTTLEYWLKRTNGNVEQAKQLQSERQRTFSLKKCIEKYGEEEGTKRWEQRQQKWSESYSITSKKAGTGISLVANSLFNSLPLNESVFTDVNNHERSITIKYTKNGKTMHKTIRPDYLNIATHKIIEFFGDYYHANPNKYSHDSVMRKGSNPVVAQDIWFNDKQRIDGYTRAGYQVHIVWESDYRNNPDKVIEQCLQFLNE